jgi:magnesium chelatase family protein
MAAQRLPSILPPLSREEAIEAIRVASACGRPLEPAAACVRPFRAPHHTISPAGLVGGGTPPRPGEITLAHRGVLFLDELAEFRRDALEALRQPLEEGRVLVARAGHAVDLPCRFQLVAAANPCPCGHGEGSAECECGAPAIRGYRTKLTGALADRIDGFAPVEQPDPETLRGDPGEASEKVRQRVLAARERQMHRLGGGRCNADMSPRETRLAALTDEAELALADGQRSFGLSARGHERVIRVARTIADLAGADRVTAEHLLEALTLRRREDR